MSDSGSSDLIQRAKDRDKILRDIGKIDRSLPEINGLCSTLSNVLDMPEADAKMHCQEAILPHILMSYPIVADSTLYFLVRKVLIFIGFHVISGPGKVVLNCVADALYHDLPEFRAEARLIYAQSKQMTSQSRRGRSRSRSSSPSPTKQPAHIAPAIERQVQIDPAQIDPSEHPKRPPMMDNLNASYTKSLTRNRQAVASNFRDDNDKFSGSIGGKMTLHKVKRTFMAVCTEQEIPRLEAVNLLHHCLSGLAKDYYYEKIKDRATTSGEAFTLLQEHFSSKHHQTQAQTYLDKLRIANIMSENGCSALKALSIANERITDTIPMCGPEMQHENHRIRILSRIVEDESWAQPTLIHRVTNPMDYNTFYTMLMASLTQITGGNTVGTNAKPMSDMGQFGTLGHLSPPAATHYSDRSAMDTHYGSTFASRPSHRNERGSNRGRHPTRSSRPPRRKRTAHELASLKARTRCMLCDQVGHWRQECPNRKRTASEAINARVIAHGNNDTALARVLLLVAEEDDLYHEYTTECTEGSFADETADSSTGIGLFHNAITEDLIEEDAQRILVNAFDQLIGGEAEQVLDIANVGYSQNFFLCIPPTSSMESSLTHDSAVDLVEIPLSTNYLEDQIRKFQGSSHSTSFAGALLDTGAQKSVMGKQQALAYCKLNNIDFRLSPSITRFKFGIHVTKSIGRITVIIPNPHHPIIEKIDVVPQNVPFLFGLDLLDKRGLQFLSVTNELECVPGKWKMPVARQFGHAYICLPRTAGTFLTKSQLERLHIHLVHPSTAKLYNLLRRSDPESVSDDTRQLLMDISKACATCTKFSRKQISFQIRDTAEVVFNHELILDIMYLRDHTGTSKPVLHIIDAGTRFSAAAFLSDVSAATLWNTFLKIWSTLYVGFPETMLTDQGSVFISAEWENACELSGITLRHTGTESHNSLGIGEKYHDTLRTIYQKLQNEFRTLPCGLILSIANKAMNDTVGPHGLVPTLLVFGTLPRLPFISKKDFPKQKIRIRAIQAARHEYERIVSREIVQRGLRKNVPPGAHHVYEPGDFAYVYRDNLKHYTGPHMVARAEGKSIFLHTGEVTGPRQFNIAQLKPCPLTRHSNRAKHTTPLAHAEVVLHTEVLEPNDQRNSEFVLEDRQEMQGLAKRGTFQIIKLGNAGPNPNILPTRMVRAIKHLANGEQKRKSRFVLGGHRDKAKQMIVHSSNRLRQKSVRLILALASILKFDVWNSDIKQAYLQADVPLQRAIFCRPPLLNLADDEIAQIVLPLYGLTDSGEYWHETLSKHHLNDLNMKQAVGDFSLFYRTIGGNLSALSGTYVDDILHAATADEKAKIMAKMKEKFEMTSPDDCVFAFIGLEIDSSDPELIKLSQRDYIMRLQVLPKNSTFELFRSVRAKISWTIHSRPDAAASSSFAAQITEKSFSASSINFVNKVIKYLQATADLCLQFPKLDPNTLRLLVYVDASFSNCADAKSQLGHIIVLADASDRCAIIDFQSHKSRRIARSSSTSETFAFVHGFDHAFLIRHDLQILIGKPIPILMLTDSDILFRNLTQARYTSERRLMIDINSAREAYNDRTISNIALIRSEYNPADAMTKVGANDALLRLIKTHRISHPIDQFIIEPPARQHFAKCSQSSKNRDV